MKIVVPTNGENGLDERVAKHFGRSLTYTLLDDKGKVIEIIKNTSQHAGGLGLPPELMKQYGADILLCRDIGPKAISLCAGLGIEVYVCQAETVKDIFKMWRDKRLKIAGAKDACASHKT